MSKGVLNDVQRAWTPTPQPLPARGRGVHRGRGKMATPMSENVYAIVALLQGEAYLSAPLFSTFTPHFNSDTSPSGRLKSNAFSVIETIV